MYVYIYIYLGTYVYMPRLQKTATRRATSARRPSGGAAGGGTLWTGPRPTSLSQVPQHLQNKQERNTQNNIKQRNTQ